MPKHNHTSYSVYGGAESGGYIGMRGVDNTVIVDNLSYTSETGGGLAHNNMPPYLAVYMWQRTA